MPSGVDPAPALSRMQIADMTIHEDTKSNIDAYPKILGFDTALEAQDRYPPDA
jgi:hypothetical protein